MQFHEFRHEMKNPHFKRAMERIASLEAENRRLREALQHIADPIKYLQQKADAEGTVVNGTQAVAMSKDPEYLKQIARAALSQEDRDGP